MTDAFRVLVFKDTRYKTVRNKQFYWFMSIDNRGLFENGTNKIKVGFKVTDNLNLQEEIDIFSSLNDNFTVFKGLKNFVKVLIAKPINTISGLVHVIQNGIDNYDVIPGDYLYKDGCLWIEDSSLKLTSRVEDDEYEFIDEEGKVIKIKPNIKIMEAYYKNHCLKRNYLIIENLPDGVELITDTNPDALFLYAY